MSVELQAHGVMGISESVMKEFMQYRSTKRKTKKLVKGAYNISKKKIANSKGGRTGPQMCYGPAAAQ
jgi:hypothetical protein